MVLFPLISGMSAAALETALNHILDSHPDIQQKLAALVGKCIQLEIEGMDIDFYMLITHSGIAVINSRTETADIYIKGPTLALIGLLTHNEKTSVLRSGKVTMTGDVLLAKHLQTILSESRIDWEDLLAQWLGDLPAYSFVRCGRYLKKEGERFINAMQDNTRVYLQEELRCLPTRIELENFMCDIDDLRANTERFHARLQRLRQQS